MQFKTLAVSLFVALAAADSLDNIAAQFPSCAKPCLEDGSKQAGCAVTDYSCQCSKISEITTNSLQCVSAACSTDDLTKTSQISTELCLAVAQQAGDGTFSSAVESLTDAAGSAFTSATGAAGSAFTSATGAAGSAFTSATGAAGSAHSSATASASPTATPAAAHHAVAGMGAFGAAAMFALAL